VGAVTVGQHADRRRGQGAQVEGAHDQADVADAVPGRVDRQQDWDQADRGPVDEREWGGPRLEQPPAPTAGQRLPPASGHGADVAGGAGVAARPAAWPRS
jgi:hypothetical protein